MSKVYLRRLLRNYEKDLKRHRRTRLSKNTTNKTTAV